MRRLLTHLPIVALLACATPALAILDGPLGLFGGVYKRGPGDVIGTTPTLWAGLRAFNRTWAAAKGNVALLLRTSDSTFKTITVLPNGEFDTKTANVFCTGTTCLIKTLYDQSGNGKDLTNIFSPNQPILLLNCIGSLPCINFPVSDTRYVNATITSVSQPYTFSIYGQRYANTNSYFNAFGSSNSSPLIGWSNSTNTMQLFCGTTELSVAANDSVWHAGVGVCNGGSSSFYVDSASFTGNSGSFATDTVISLGEAQANAPIQGGYVTEVGLWPVGFSATQAQALIANQQAYW